MLQLSKMTFDTPLGIFGAAAAALGVLHLFIMTFQVAKSIITYERSSGEAQGAQQQMQFIDTQSASTSEGVLIGIRKDNALSRYFVLLKMTQKFFIVMFTVLLYDFKVVYMLIGACFIMLVAEIVIRPYTSYCILCSSVLLNAFYLAGLVAVQILALSSESAHSYFNTQAALENILLIFLIVKNLVVLIDFLMLCRSLREHIRKSNTSQQNSAQAFNQLSEEA